MKNSSATAKSYHLGDKIESSPEGICNLFADYFASVFIPDDGPIPEYSYNTPINISECVLREHDVERKLITLDPSKGTGPDEIPPSILRYCSSLLAPHLTVVFNRLLQIGIFPDILKNSFVVPIFKSSDSSDVRNYRPIVIQPALGKVFESLVLDCISFKFKNVLSLAQHGFSAGRSTSTNLVLYNHYIHSAFQNGCQVDGVYIDFAKAFDTVSHKRLLAKLKAYGILGNLLLWFQSYLHNRKLIVKYSGGTSLPFLATSGVPQGSHLGPFLFVIFLNDIFDLLTVNCLSFADDIKVFLAINSIEDCRRLQRGLTIIEEWCATNSMKINAGKCAIISFNRSTKLIWFDYTLDGVVVNRVQSTRDLGVVLSSNLSPGAHIDVICNKASRALGFLLRTARCGLSIEAMKYIYTALVRSVLEYCSVVWSPYQLGHIQRLQRIQDRFTRIVGVRLGFEYRDVPTGQIEEFLGLQPLERRRQLHDLMFMRSVIVGELDCPGLLGLIDYRVPSGTRSSDVFSRRAYHTNYGSNSTLPRLHRLGNLVSPHLDLLNVSARKLKQTFLSM